MPRKQHTIADVLSWRLRHLKDNKTDEEDINKWILAELGAYEICLIVADNSNKESREEDPELRSRRLVL